MRGASLSLALLVGLSVSPLSAQSAPQARAALRSGDYEQAIDLYRNELAWENITEEEEVEGEPLAELTFAGFLAFIQGLLLEKVMPDSLAPANPRPEIVEEVVDFLAERVVALQDELGEPEDGEAGHRERDLAVTDRLLDLVLLRLHGVDPTDAEGFRDAAPAT